MLYFMNIQPVSLIYSNHALNHRSSIFLLYIILHQQRTCTKETLQYRGSNAKSDRNSTIQFIYQSVTFQPGKNHNAKSVRGRAVRLSGQKIFSPVEQPSVERRIGARIRPARSSGGAKVKKKTSTRKRRDHSCLKALGSVCGSIIPKKRGTN